MVKLKRPDAIQKMMSEAASALTRRDDGLTHSITAKPEAALGAGRQAGDRSRTRPMSAR